MLTVVFDQDCGLCNAVVRWLQARGQFEFVGNRAAALPAGVTRELAQKTVVVVDPQRGRTWVRASAVAVILRQLRGWRLLGVLMALPPLSWAADLGYRVFSGQRRRVSRLVGLEACGVPQRPPTETRQG